MRIFGPFNSGVGAGGAGTATSNATTSTELCGKIYGIYIRYNDSPPAATTDVTIATAGVNYPAVTLLTLTNAATDGLFLPRKAVVDLAGAAFASQSIAEAVPVDDKIKVTIAQANDGDSIDIWLFLE